MSLKHRYLLKCDFHSHLCLILESLIINSSWTKTINSCLYCDVQVYTRFHIIQSDPGAEVGDCGGLSVCVCTECIIAISHVGSVCRNPSPTQLGAGALHHRLPHYEVWFLIFGHLIAKSKLILIKSYKHYTTQTKPLFTLHKILICFLQFWFLELIVHCFFAVL